MDSNLTILITLFLIVFLISWLFISVIVYFIPTIIAVIRKHQNVVAVCVLNIFLGWTVLGWIASLLWSLNSDINKEKENGSN